MGLRSLVARFLRWVLESGFVFVFDFLSGDGLTQALQFPMLCVRCCDSSFVSVFVCARARVREGGLMNGWLWVVLFCLFFFLPGEGRW